MHQLYAIFSNKKERDAMWTFLQDVDWERIRSTETSDVQGPLMGEDMGFKPAKGRNVIGFLSTDHPQWVWAVGAWMALRSTQRVNDWAVLKHDVEEIVVMPQDHAETEKGVLVVDQDGLLKLWRDKELPQGPDHVRQQEFVQQLNEQWNAQAKPKTKSKAS